MNDGSQIALPRPEKAILALLVDGDNLSHTLAGQTITRSMKFGNPVIRRVYGNAAKMPGWDMAPGFKLVHSGNGKNATDLLLAVEAMALVYTGRVDTVVIASSDRDFTHLANHLREAGKTVIGLGEAKAPEAFRKACSSFVEIGEANSAMRSPTQAPVNGVTVKQLSDLDSRLRELIKKEGDRGGFPMSLLNERMHKLHRVKISDHAPNWRIYLQSKPELYACDPKGPAACVRLVNA